MARQLKDSGFSWIGKIPVDWDVQKVKNAFYRSKEEAHIEDPVVLSLARSGVKIRDISTNEGQLAESYYNYNPVIPGDLLLNPMDLYSGANCSVSNVEGVISPAYINLRTRGNYSPTYYDYYFKTQYWAMSFFAHGKGVSFDNRWTLSPNDLFNYAIPVPSFNEQECIAEFLDRKCAEIDSVIEKTKQSIEEYRKIRLSVITTCVTKGLRGTRPMKVSGIKWVKEIPAEWENRKMLSILSMRVIDGPHESPELFDDGVPYVSANAIENGRINFDKKRGFISKEYCDQCDKRYRPQRNDILVIKLGATTGQVAIVDTDERFNIWVPLAAVRCNHLALPKFVYYAMQSDYYIRQMEMSWTYGTQQTLGVKTIERLRIIIPNLDEQKEIADYLEKKCAEIDTLIAKKTALLEEMESYKKSVIYEYVTGKKEV